MADLLKYDMTDIWAVAGDVVAPDPAKVRAGWGVEVVPRQWWNWFENRQDQNIAYMLQKGFPEWDATTQYIINKSYVQRNNVVYRATATSTNSDPIALTSWVKAFPNSTAASEALAAVTPSASSMAYFTSSSAAATTSLTAFGRSIAALVDAAAARTLFSAQVSHANLTALSGVTANTNILPYFTSTSAMTGTTFTAFARTLLDDADATTARATLGLGTAAVANLTTSTADVTVGNVLRVADYGIGAQGVLVGSLDALTNSATGFYKLGTPFTGSPVASTACSVIHQAYDSERTQIAIIEGGPSVRYFVRKYSSAAWQAWAEFWHTGNTSTDVKAILGAANYAAIRTLLSLANKAEAGANSDITSLAGLTTALSVLQGGTGTTTSTGTGNTVRSASPTFTGTPLTTTAAPGTNTTQIASTAFVAAADALKANLASPALTGTPTAPTAAGGTNNTQIATTAFVTTQINSLGLTPQSSAVDGTTGRILAVGAFGLGSVGADSGNLVTSITGTIRTGFYKFNGGATGAPPQLAGVGGSLIVHSMGGNYIQQIVISIPTALDNPVMCLRHYDTSGNPGAWVTISTNANMIGTVSVSGVLPTGAIIETATNANGTYTKFTDGTLICQGPIADMSVGAGAITLTPNGTFGHPFVSGAYYCQVLGAPNTTNDHYGFTSVNSRATTAVNYVHRNGATAQIMTNIRYVAIGRWF